MNPGIRHSAVAWSATTASAARQSSGAPSTVIRTSPLRRPPWIVIDRQRKFLLHCLACSRPAAFEGQVLNPCGGLHRAVVRVKARVLPREPVAGARCSLLGFDGGPLSRLDSGPDRLRHCTDGHHMGLGRS